MEFDILKILNMWLKFEILFWKWFEFVYIFYYYESVWGMWFF